MNDAIAVRNLTKTYDGFTLDHIGFTLPGGCIMGLIGENGAGKSTTIKLLLGLTDREEGEISLLGKSGGESSGALKENIGVVMDDCCFPETLTASQIGSVLRSIYKTWDTKKYKAYLKEFSLPQGKSVKDFSRGMKMKLSIACALSHDTRLLILDEATSGLDPVVRDNILDTFFDFIQDDQHSILMSSHIVSDLEKICDYITFLHQGKVVFSQEKDRLLEMYGILRCPQEQIGKLPDGAVIAKRGGMFGADALVRRDKMPGGLVVDRAGIEDIMLYFTAAQDKGGAKRRNAG